MQRREWLKAIGAIGIGLVAGCSSQNESVSTTTASTTTKTTQTTTENTTIENETPESDQLDSIAPIINDDIDAWFCDGHDPNNSLYNSGGSGPKNQPNFIKSWHSKLPHIIQNGHIYYLNKELPSKLVRWSFLEDKREILLESSHSPLYLKDNWLIAEFGIPQLINLQKREWIDAYDPEEKFSNWHSQRLYDSNLVLVTEKGVHSVEMGESGFLLNWTVIADRLEEYRIEAYLQDSILIKEKNDSVYLQLRVSDGEVIDKGDDLLSQIKLSKLVGGGGVTQLDQLEEYDEFAYTRKGIFAKHGNSIIAINTETNSKIWESPGDGIKSIANETLYVSRSSKAVALDALTGEEKWSVEVQNSVGDIIPTQDSLLVTHGHYPSVKTSLFQ